jgi:hypothetical protein
MPSWAPKARWDASTTRCFMREKLWLIKYNWWEEGTTWQTHHPISASALLVATSLPRAQWTRRGGRNTTSRSRHQGQRTDRPRRGSRESPGVPTRFTRLEEESTGRRWKTGSRPNAKSTPKWKRDGRRPSPPDLFVVASDHLVAVARHTGQEVPVSNHNPAPLNSQHSMPLEIFDDDTDGRPADAE